MHTWPVQDAKARFSEFLDACLLEGPSLKQLLLSDQARTDMSVAPRGRAKRRPVEPMM